MKIVIVSHDADFTGAPRIGFDIASELGRDHDVRLVSKREGPLIDLPKYAGLREKYVVTKTSHAYGIIPFNERVRRAVEMLREEKPALLYANSSASAEWCVAARQLAIPSVLHTHEMQFGLRSLSACDVLKFDIPRYVDLLVSASQEASDDFAALTCEPVERHFLFGIAIDVAYVREKADERVALPRNVSGRTLSRDKTVVAMCGMASARKGFDIFYESACALPEAEFLWVGPEDGDATAIAVMERYKAEATDNFFVVGETPNPYPYIKLCDVFALSSVEDPNPLVVPEALALGRRVVSFQETGGSWRWTRRFGYSLSGKITAERMVAFLRRMLGGSASSGWIEHQASDLYNAVDLTAKMPLLRQQLSSLVGATV
jgi:Glycosyl transferases group 1